MPKLIALSILTTLFFSATALGQSGLRTAKSVQVESGFIDESVVLSDDAGQLFLEFIQGDRVAKKLDGQIYEGEILPPIQIDAPAKAPRARMRELISFEVISDSSEEVEMIDQFTALHPKDRLRQGFKNQAGERRLGAQLITLFPPETEVSRPALWHYDTSQANARWERLGGIKGETPAGEDRVFSAFIYGTGQFTIWDENPLPTFSPTFPLDEIEFAEDSPFPSVTETEETEFLEAELEAFESELDEFGEILNDDTATNLVPAVEAPEGSEDLVPAVGPLGTETDLENSSGVSIPNSTLTPIPSDLLSSSPVVPASGDNDTILSEYFQENLLIVSAEQGAALDAYSSVLAVQEANTRNLLLSALNSGQGNNTSREADNELLIISLMETDFANLAVDVLESIDQQVRLARGTSTASEQQRLWDEEELPRGNRILNLIQNIENLQVQAGSAFQSNLNRNDFRTMINLLPALKRHYQAYLNLPVVNASALQANNFQDFGTNEGDLPVAGGFRFPWLLLVVVFIVGFSVYTIRQKPY